MWGKTKLRLTLGLPPEAMFLRSALKDRYDKVAHDEKILDAWELSAISRLTNQVQTFLDKHGIRG